MRITDRRASALPAEAEQRQFVGVTTLKSPSDFFKEWAGISSSTTGVRVTTKSALQLSAVFTCVRILSDAIAQLPLSLMRRTDDGHEVQRRHPAHSLLRFMRGSIYTPFMLRSTQGFHLHLYGDSFTRIYFGPNGRPDRLEIIEPQHIQRETKAGVLTWRASMGGVMMDLDDAEVLHLPGLSHNGIEGLTPTDLHRETIAAGIAARDYATRLMGNGTIRGIIEHPTKFKNDADATKFVNTFNGSGLQGGYGTPVLQHGMKFQPLDMKAADAEVDATSKAIRNQIAAAYGVPPYMLGDNEKDTYGNREQSAQGFVVQTLQPIAVKIEQELNRKLLFDRELDDHSFKHNFDGLLRGDTATRHDAYSRGINDGWMTPNEAREKENLPRLDGLDKPLRPLNMAEAGDDSDPDEPTENQQRSQVQALRPLVAEKLAVIRRREVGAMGKDTDPVERVERFTDQQDRAASDLFATVGDAMAAMTGENRSSDFVGLVQRALRDDMANAYAAAQTTDDLPRIAQERADNIDDAVSRILALAVACFEVDQ